MKLGPKLLAAPLATALVLLACGQVNSWLMMREASVNQQAFRANLENVESLAKVQQRLGEMHAGVYRTLTIISSLDEAKVKAFRADLKRQFEAAKGLYTAAAGADADPAMRESQQRVGVQIDKYLKEADAAIDMSGIDANTGVAMMQSADATFAQLMTIAGAIEHGVDTASTAKATASEAASRRNNLLFGALSLLVATAAVGVSWLTQRRMVHALAQAASVAARVAQGQLDAVPASQRQDEIGDVQRALSLMTSALSRSLRTVQESSSSIHSASIEIASGNADLSARTEQAASSLQQTASSMEQLTGTVTQSADAARQANQLANSAAEVARRGGSMVAQVVSTMDDINTSSKKIADIIGVIDGIAFQTNILALNAAVEAARAGEQGRGFAVVASEVRSLAQRSAEAAREIKALIGASVDKVECGARLVADTGSTMSEIVASVQRVSDIIGEISAASAEQSSGIGEVNGAVTSLDRMTQQNAALVEQSAAAAESLKEQAARLGEVVRQFTLEGVAA